MKRTTFVVGLILLIAACGGVPESNTPGPGVDLSEAFSQLETLATPPGVADSTFQELKDSLAGAMRASGKTRFASAVPGNESAVDDLSLTLLGSSIRLSWT